MALSIQIEVDTAAIAAVFVLSKLL